MKLILTGVTELVERMRIIKSLDQLLSNLYSIKITKKEKRNKKTWQS